MKTIEYKFKGTRRKINAIGEPEKFTGIVYRQTGTMSPLEAMDTYRKDMYENNFEHILFTSCFIRKNNLWVEIPMLQALEME